MQRELTDAGPLLDASGRLIQPGWARQPVLAYDRNQVRGRLKEWDYYCLFDGQRGFAVTVADLGVVGLLALHWLDFEAGTFQPAVRLRPFQWGRMGLPPSSREGDVRVSWGGRSIQILRHRGEREIRVDWPRFDGARPLSAHVFLRADDDEDSLVVATPFAEHPTGFYYNHKINCLLAEGHVRIGDAVHGFTPERAQGGLDWGRGVWPYSNDWYWASASCRVDGRRVGWNLGYGFGDLSTHSENIVFVDGVGHKLDQVRFEIDDWLAPWRFTSNDGRFEMRFDPILDRNDDVNLGIFRSTQHQVFGHYSGTVILDDGGTLEVERVLGFAEKVVNRW